MRSKNKKSLTCAHLGLCHGSVPQMKIWGGRIVANTHRLGQPRGGCTVHSSNCAEGDINMLCKNALWLQSHRWMQMYMFNIFLHAWRPVWVMLEHNMTKWDQNTTFEMIGEYLCYVWDSLELENNEPPNGTNLIYRHLKILYSPVFIHRYNLIVKPVLLVNDVKIGCQCYKVAG